MPQHSGLQRSLTHTAGVSTIRKAAQKLGLASHERREIRKLIRKSKELIQTNTYPRNLKKTAVENTINKSSKKSGRNNPKLCNHQLETSFLLPESSGPLGLSESAGSGIRFLNLRVVFGATILRA